MIRFKNFILLNIIFFFYRNIGNKIKLLIYFSNFEKYYTNYIWRIQEFSKIIFVAEFVIAVECRFLCFLQNPRQRLFTFQIAAHSLQSLALIVQNESFSEMGFACNERFFPWYIRFFTYKELEC